MADIEKLKALAEKAGSGNWYEAGELRYHCSRSGDTHGLHHDEDRFIAAATPDAVLELIAEVERLREKVRGVETARTSRNAEMDGKVHNYLRDRTGSTAWAMAGAIGATREEVSKACQRLRRKGLIETSATQLTYWQAVKA